MTSTDQSALPLETALTALERGQSLTAGQAAAAFGVVMRGEATTDQIKALLLGLRAKGETFEEIAGAAQALRQAMITVRPSAGSPIVDTCGTGGGQVGTFNISTAAGFVVAAAGVRVAKHGNRSYTSKCGSADVLEALGVDITVAPDRIATLLDHAGMAFLFAPNFHPAMRHVGPVRKELGDSVHLMADANSAYTLADADRLAQLDAFNLIMIEQPLVVLVSCLFLPPLEGRDNRNSREFARL